MKKEQIVQTLKSYFQEVKSERQTKELEWLSNLRQYKGKYDPDILSKIREYGGSEVFPRYTRSKVNPLVSKINQVFFPLTDKSWSIEVDRTQPIPTIIMNKVNQELQQYNPEELTKNKVKKIIQNILQEYKSNVEYEISEQIKEMKFEEKFKQANYSAILYGTGVLKGILTKEKTMYDLELNGNEVVQIQKKVNMPYIEYIPIWDIYPDMSTYDPDKISYVFQTHKMSKKELIELSDEEGFDKKTILRYIETHPDGDYQKFNYEVQLEILSSEESKPKSVKNKYLVLEYWGFIDGRLLDKDKYDPSKSYMASIWLLGDKIISFDTFPIDTPNNLYHFYYYEKDDSSIFGEGLPSILKGTQLTIGATARMIIDNATSVVGDQLEVNVDLLIGGQDISRQYPRKIWYREGRGQEAQYPAIRSISANSHISEYATIISLFKQFGDEESNLPAFIWGNSDQLPANTTATGMNQLSSNTNMSIADIVRGYEKENVKILTQLIDWNRDNSDINSEEYSIHYIVSGFGYESQVYKENMLQALSQFNNSIRPEDEIYINKLALYKHELKLLGIPFNDIIFSEKEVEENIARQQDPEAIQLAKEKEAADIEYTKSKATHMLAKSKETLEKATQ